MCLVCSIDCVSLSLSRLLNLIKSLQKTTVTTLTLDGKVAGTGVFLRFKNQVIPNNSYISYYRIKNTLPDRIYCHTDSTDCCTDINGTSNWFLPNGDLILGGYDYENVLDGVFARSRGFGMVALYRLYRPQQSGKFKCVIPDSSGRNRTLYVSIFYEIPTLTMQPISQKVMKGDNITFSVDVSTNNFVTYLWQKDYTFITDESGRYQGITSPILIITNTQKEDGGNYRCVIDEFLVSDSAELIIGELVAIKLCIVIQGLTCITFMSALIAAGLY